MWDDVVLCERRGCPLSQSTGKLRGSRHTARVSGRPRGDALCRARRRSLSQHGISAAARRLRLHWEATHADHQSDKRPSRLRSTSTFYRFVSMQQQNWSVGGDVSVSEAVFGQDTPKDAKLTATAAC